MDFPDPEIDVKNILEVIVEQTEKFKHKNYADTWVSVCRNKRYEVYMSVCPNIKYEVYVSLSKHKVWYVSLFERMEWRQSVGLSERNALSMTITSI